MRTLGLGIVGCGGAAVDVARAAAGIAGLSVVALHDRDRVLADDLATASGGRVHATLAGLLDDPAVDIVYVAVPHDVLAPLARQALDAGRHVLVEKPMAISLAAIDELDAIARERSRTLGVFYELRFGPAAVVARCLVRRGAIADVGAIRIRTLIDKPADYWRSGPTGRSASPWRGQRTRAGGGVVLMNASHQLDLVGSITGLSMTDVSGVVATLTEGIDVEDVASATFRLSNGAVGSLAAGAHVPGTVEGETIEIDGSSGQLTLDPYAGRLRLFLRRPWRGRPAGRWLDVEVGSADPFARALRSFTASVRTGARPRAGAREARAVLAVVQAIYRSSAEGRVVSPDAAAPST